MARRESQSTKMLDVTRSYVPVDPNAFPITLHSASGEDSPERAKQVVPYEGYNFLPTSYGYKSYFGLTSKMDIDALTSRVDYLLILQTSQFVNIAVALCENGIWTKRADSTGAWTQEIPLPLPELGVHYDWSYCFIDNDFFAYRAGNASYYRFSNIPRAYSPIEIEAALPTIIPVDTMHPANEFYEQTPNFLNMEGQMGLFKAGSRLGFWDSANSISWSSIDDFLDFTPAVLTAAGSSKFLEVQGRITNILAMADGFVVYSTKSITLVARDDSGAMQWNPLVLMKDSGVAFKRECCAGASVTSQFAYTTTGLVKIEGTKADYIVPEISDFLKESREPVFLTLIEGRYLFLELLDSNYVNGLVEFKTKTIPADTITYPINPVVPDAIKQETVETIFTGLNEDIRNQINAYIEANSMPAMIGAYEPIVTYTKNDEKLYLPLSEELPIFYPKIYSQSALNNSPIISPINPADSSGAIGSFTGVVGIGCTQPTVEYRPLQVYAPVPIIKSRDDSGTMTASGLADWYVKQQEVWQTNDETFAQVAQYILSGSRDFLVGLVYNNFVGGSNPARLTYSTTSNGTIEAVRPTLNNTDDLDMLPSLGYDSYGTQSSKWSPPALTITNNVVVLKRQREAVIGFSSRGKWKTDGNVRCVDVAIDNAQNFLYIRLDIYGAQFSTIGLPNNPEQSSSIVIDEYNYWDALGNMHTIPSSAITLPEITPFVYQYSGSVTLPPVSFLLQNGSIGPVYPTIPGALVYDLQLQKWGKMKNDYKVLIDWSPLNNTAGNTIPYETFGMQGGILQPDGKIALFDKYPIDSYIKYGKIGYYRQGVTSAEEVRVVFRSACTGKIITETSLDNVSLELGLGRQEDYTNARDVVIYPSTTGKWHTISLIGQYDILNVEFRGTKVGNR